MSDPDVRAGIQQAKVGETGLAIVSAEALVISSIVGVRAQSWAAGIFVFLGMFVLFSAMAASEKLANGLAVVIGVAWGIVAFLLAVSLQATTSTTWAVAILAGVIGGGGHMAGFQHVRDIQKARG